MPPVLFVDLEDAGVLLIRGRENPRGLTRQKKRRESAAAADHAPDDKHAATLTPAAVFANPGCPAAWRAHSDGAVITGNFR